MSGRAAAKQLVDGIWSEHGHLLPEIWNGMSDEVRRAVEQAFHKKDRMIASSVMTLARNLYTSNARFVFELLQNAEDNHYSKAQQRNEKPMVSFFVYPSKIIVECNEDGFTSANLTAICDVGKSSKKGVQGGYIGEKGIGFKSVFMAAYKVLIQSGDFSFSFTHRQTDSGMGMVSPVWEEPDESVPDTVTRITLFLHDEGEPDELARQRTIIRNQFQEIHDSLLLFLKKLQSIDIHFFDDDDNADDEASSRMQFSIKHMANGRVAITKHTESDEESSDDVRYYHTTNYVVDNLAKNDNRTYSEEEIASKAYAKGEVVLAFPLTGTSVPITENEWVFAFLPIIKMGFKFLIQADFVTQANRQGIVTTSARNEGLADGIARAFIKAVLQFCEHDTLQYQWMRYLPKKEGYSWDGYWANVIDKIESLVQSTPVLRPASGKALQLIKNMRRHTDSQLDPERRPLFADITPEQYLSPQYLSKDLKLLSYLGLKHMFMDEMLRRVQHDLASSFSRWKLNTDEGWQRRAAILLHIPFQRGWENRQNEVKKMQLLPLRVSGWECWTSGSSGQVYYPKVAGTGLDIPANLSLDVLRPNAVCDPHKRKLFDCVGVKEASVSFIRERILTRYSASPQITLASAVEHLRFLYLTQHLVQPPYKYEQLRIFLQNGKLENPKLVDSYIADDEPYGAMDLLSPTPPGSSPGDGAPGYNVLFVNKDYFREPPNAPTVDSLSWKDWFHTYFHVRRYPRLIHKDGDETSPECNYIMKHRPDKFMAFLRTTWDSEKSCMKDKDFEDVVYYLSCSEVLCEGGEKHALCQTYLPTDELKQIAGRFLLNGEAFSWLNLETSIDPVKFPVEWRSLGEEFGLGLNGPDLKFALHVLLHINQKNPSAGRIVQPDRIYNLYIYIQAKVRESNNLEDCREIMLSELEYMDSVFIPGSDARDATWAEPSECVWEAPIEMKTKHSIADMYAANFEQFEADKFYLAEFFKGMLNVPECTWRNLVDELRHLKSSNCADVDRIKKVYECLAEMCPKADELKELKQLFENEGLIYTSTNMSPSWHKTSQCLWSAATRISGMHTINNLYGDLKKLFVSQLGVQTMTAKMVYEKLIGVNAQDGQKLTIQEAKETVLAFNDFIKSENDIDKSFDIDEVLEKALFPVRLPNGQVELRKGFNYVVLIDRKHLADDFADKAEFLDFTLMEVKTLEPFITWAGLELHYLSMAVQEITSVDPSSTRPISSVDRDIKRKAYALLRICLFYGGHRTSSWASESLDEFYRLLRNAKTFETDQITSELLLEQNGKELRVVKKTASLHIDEGANGLTIYVPSDPRQQEICFNGKLSRRLCEWMMQSPDCDPGIPAEAVNAVQSILNAKSFALPAILEELGIAEIETPEVEELDSDNTGTSTEVRPRTPDQSRHEASQPYISDSDRRRSTANLATPPPSTHATPLSRPAGEIEIQSPLFNRIQVGRAVASISAHSSFGVLTQRPQPVGESPTDHDDYPALVRSVVSSARQATFPSRGTFDMSAMRAALPAEASDNDEFEGGFRVRSTNQLERDKKVGAAGELLVFEILSHLDPQLPNFARPNWRSNIRGYVNCHPEYSDMSSWSGFETADIVYDDTSGALTSFLISKGYLPSQTWANARPDYFIEVKSTTGRCETPFFMSKYQFKRMRDHSQTNANRAPRTKSVYIIFRVFNLGKSSVDFRILVDPEAMRLKGELAFTAETWSIVATK